LISSRLRRVFSAGIVGVLMTDLNGLWIVNGLNTV